MRNENRLFLVSATVPEYESTTKGFLAAHDKKKRRIDFLGKPHLFSERFNADRLKKRKPRRAKRLSKSQTLPLCFFANVDKNNFRPASIAHRWYFPFPIGASFENSNNRTLDILKEVSCKFGVAGFPTKRFIVDRKLKTGF